MFSLKSSISANSSCCYLGWGLDVVIPTGICRVSASPQSPSKQGSTLEKPWKLVCILWGSGNTANPICSMLLGTELAVINSSYLSMVRNFSKLYFIVIKEVHTGFFHSICWKPKAGAGNLFAVNFSHKIHPIYTLLTGHLCLGSKFKTGSSCHKLGADWINGFVSS